MNVAETLRLVQLRIRTAAGDEEIQQAREIVGYVLGVEPAALPLHHGMSVNEAQLEAIGEMAGRRAEGEPLQYLLGGWEFMGLPILLEPTVLIPRPETELLCERALALMDSAGYSSVLDLCCGSGCIGIALAKRSGAAVTAADVSGDCLRLTQENAQLNGVDVRTVQSDLFNGIEGVFDLIVSNPPYLSAADMAEMQRELTYEPRIALYGGADGLDFYRRIAAGYRAHLREGGVLLMEIGATQADAVRTLFPGAAIYEDYAGNPRIAEVKE